MSNKTIEQEKLEQTILAPIINIGWKFYLFTSLLIIVIAIGALAWLIQLQLGLGVTGLSHRVFWGVYISNFIFFIGISYS